LDLPVTRLYLVRHGRATGGWDDDLDPGVDEIGRRQAEDAAERLAPVGPLSIITSPLRRCRETARPLAERWGIEPVVLDAITEIPSPPDVAFGERVPWLRRAMAGTWGELGVAYTDFRDGILTALAALDDDTVAVSHFIAINAVIGAALGDDRLVIRSLDNCSVTVVDIATGAVGGVPDVRLVEAGHEADTLIR
jgi:broad specificity phosphatase PhoE